MEVKVLFFGVLTDVAGTTLKYYKGARTVGELVIMIQDDFPEIVHYNYRIAVNNEITDNDLPLKQNDEVALMPPFAGG